MGFDVDFIKQTLKNANDCYVAGMENSPANRQLALILREYDACKRFENVKIPTRLELAIEAARKA